MPRVTIIVPSYNYSSYLGEAIDSLVAQTFEDWGAIVIDDASTDQSRDVLARVRDSRIRCVFHSENLGHIATYNEGHRLARGEYVALLAADDRYTKTFLAATVQMLESHPDSGLAYTGTRVIDAKGRGKYTRRNWHPVSGVYEELPLLVLGNRISHHSVVIRRSVLDQVGLYDPRFPCAGDWQLWLRIARQTRFSFINEPLYEYRVHSSSMTVHYHRSDALENEHRVIVDEVLRDPTLPPTIKAMRREILGAQRFLELRSRLVRRDLVGSIEALGKVLNSDPAALLAPMNWLRLAHSTVRGIVKLPNWGRL